LDRATGKIVWTAETGEREAFVSDPVLLNNELVVLAVSREADQGSQVRQYSLSPRTGDVVARHDVVRVRNSWATRSCAQVAACGEGIVAVLGGVTLSTTADGDVRWIRKHLTLPAEDDPRWILQMYERPVVVGERVFVAQPGVRTVECLDLATGRSIWQAVLPEVVGIIGLAGEMLIVRTEIDVRGLDVKDGTTRWRSGGEMIVGFPVCDETRVMVARRNRAESGRQRVVCDWLNASDGQTIARNEVEGLAEDDLRLGPVVGAEGRVWALVERGQNETGREVMELVEQTK
jgi:outer membrane protein assembly factor BamB